MSEQWLMRSWQTSACLWFILKISEQHSNQSLTGKSLENLIRSTPTKPQQINKSHQANSPKPHCAKPSQASSQIHRRIVMEIKGIVSSFFYRTCWSWVCFEMEKTVSVWLNVKWVGRLYQQALWESQWERNQRGNVSSYPFVKEQKQSDRIGTW